MAWRTYFRSGARGTPRSLAPRQEALLESFSESETLGRETGRREETSTQEAVMALVHPTSRTHVPLTKRKFHPAVCLATGFGFIIGAALTVHVVFNLIF